MADLTVSVPDAMVTRIREAFGNDARGSWQLASLVEVRAAIKTFIRMRVKDYEARQASEIKQQEVEDEDWS